MELKHFLCDLEMISELTNEEEKKLEQNLVWVLGSPRSGITWLARELLSFNTSVVRELNISEHLGTSVWGITEKIVRNIDFRKSHPDYFFSEKYKPVWMHFLRKLILNRIYAQFCDTTKKRGEIVLKKIDDSDTRRAG